MSTASSLSFDNTENAFAYKSDRELKKARFLFSTMKYPLLVRWATRLTPWLLRTGLPVKGIIRNTIFEQFVGGETLGETAGVAKKLSEYKVQVILDYGVEGGQKDEAAFEQSMEKFKEVIQYASTQPNIPFMSVKVTGFARSGLLEKLDSSVANAKGSLMKRYGAALESLNSDEKQEWQNVQRRMEGICRLAAEKGIGVLVDAEETWIQDPVDVMTILMMEKFNQSKPVVYNTVQLYRHDRLNFLKDSLDAAELRGFILGVKLVRGAYMEKERERAKELDYTSPIQSDKSATDQDFDRAIHFCIDHLEKIAVIIATHNENSCRYAVERMQEKSLPVNHSHIHFSQLYGMSDPVTFNLAKAGYLVSKYLPFGPIRDVIPYLMRRAQENTTVTGQTGRELVLIKKELQRRKQAGRPT